MKTTSEFGGTLTNCVGLISLASSRWLEELANKPTENPNNYLALIFDIVSEMFCLKVRLPNAESRARLIGKDGAKIRDVEAVSGASLRILKEEVWITGSSKVSTELAEKLVIKSIQHGTAANKVVVEQAEVKDVIMSDLLMAAHFTHCN